MLRDDSKRSRLLKRIEFIRFEGQEILSVDFTGCSAAEVEAIARLVPDYVSQKPRNSVLILTNFADASFNDDALRTMKETAVFDKPYVKKSALIGTESLPRHFYDDLTNFSRRTLPVFRDREKALLWLVGKGNELHTVV